MVVASVSRQEKRDRVVITTDSAAPHVEDPTFGDVVRAALGSCLGDDLLWLTQLESGAVRLVCARRQSDGVWWIETSSSSVIEPDTAWTFTDARSDQATSLREAYDSFIEWLGDGALLCDQTRLVAPEHLVVKVDTASLWFLRFPLSAFNQLGFELLKPYRAVEWIVTDKTFVRHGEQRAVIRREMSDLALFLSRTVVVLNTYREFERDERCANATSAIVRLLRLMRDVRLGNESLSLRWYLNPSTQMVRELLLDSSTSYFFADFEASTGKWESGEGARVSWDSQEDRGGSREPILIDPASDDLSHVRLMRVFHCNSIFDPFSDRPPASGTTIVGELLRAGAWRVEGGMTKELYLDYLRSLTALVFENRLLAFMLREQARAKGVALHEYATALDFALK